MKAALLKVEISNIGTVVVLLPDHHPAATGEHQGLFENVSSLRLGADSVDAIYGVIGSDSILGGVTAAGALGVAIFKDKNDIVSSDNMSRMDTVHALPKAEYSATREVARYAAAAILAAHDNWEAANRVLARSIRDKALVDMSMNAFTPEERAEVLKVLCRAVSEPNLRMRGGMSGPNYVPGENTPCVMDLITTLKLAGATMYPYHELAETYERISAQQVDPKSIFKADYAKAGGGGLNSLTADFSRPVLANGLFNISLRCKIPGTVTLNPRSAERVNLPRELPTYEHRRFTLIQDGKVHIEKIIVKIEDPEVAVQLRNLGYSISTLSELENIYAITVPKHIFNRRYINSLMSGREMADEYRLEFTATIRKYVLRVLLAKKGSQEVSKAYRQVRGTAWASQDQRHESIRYERRSGDQIKVLKDHGINSSGNYIGIQRQLVLPTEEQLQKMVREYRLMIPGFSQLPEMEKVLEKVEKAKAENKEPNLTVAQKTIFDTYESFKDLSTVELVSLLLTANKKIELSRLRIWTNMTLTRLLGKALEGEEVVDESTTKIVAGNGTEVLIKTKLVNSVSATASYID